MAFVFLPHHIQSPKGAEKNKKKRGKHKNFNTQEIPIAFPILTTPNTSNEGNGKTAIIITTKREEKENRNRTKKRKQTKPKMNKRKRKRKAQTSNVKES